MISALWCAGWRSGSMLSAFGCAGWRSGAGMAAVSGSREGGWILERVGAERERVELGESEVTVGRGLDVTHRLLARNCPLMISRNHCSFRVSPERQCTVTDNQSLNGVWVNGKRIEPLQAYPLREGDLIQLGVPLHSKEQAEYLYRLAWQQKVLPPTVEEPAMGSSTGNKEARRVKRKHNPDETMVSDAESVRSCKTKLQRVCDSHPLSSNTSQEGQCGMTERVDSGTERVDSGTERVDSGTGQEGQCDTAESEIPGTSREGQCGTAEREVPGTSWRRKAFDHRPGRRWALSDDHGAGAQAQEVASGKSWQSEGPCHRAEGLQRQQEELEGNLERQTQELELLKKPCQTQQQQREQELEAALSRQRKELEDIIRAKDRELEERKGKVQMEETAAQFTDVLENELQCSICSEHFIEAVTLNCSHSFCCHCILEWRKRKEECPICRQTIRSQTRSVVLDNCIERMLESLSEAVRDRRQQLLQERKALKSTLPESGSSSSDDLASIQSISSDSSSDTEEPSEEGDTEESPLYYII